MPKRIKPLHSIDSILIGNYCFANPVLIKDEDTILNSHFQEFYRQKDSSEYIDIFVSITSKMISFKITAGDFYNLDKYDTINSPQEYRFDNKKVIDRYVFYEESSNDTILDLGKRDEIKYWNGKYYLNHKIENHDWETYQLEMINDSIISINLTNDKDAVMLGLDHSEWKPVFNYVAKISNKRFQDFIDSGGFRTRFILKRITPANKRY